MMRQPRHKMASVPPGAAEQALDPFRPDHRPTPIWVRRQPNPSSASLSAAA